MPTPPAVGVCLRCGVEFPFRSNRKFCSTRCRKASSQQTARAKTPANARNSPTVKREQYETYELARLLADNLYALPPFERLGYLEELIQQARSGRHPRLRRILTNPELIFPDRNKHFLFPRGWPVTYCTIAQAAERYCRWSPWRAGVASVVRGEVPEPDTGEIVEGEGRGGAMAA